MNTNQIIQEQVSCRDAISCVSTRRLLSIVLIIAACSLALFSQLKTAKLIATFDEKDKHYIDTVYCKEKYETTFILPKERKIKQAVVGDPDEWEVLAKYGGSILSVKPLHEAEHTSLTIVTQSLKVYKFNIVNIKTVANPGFDVMALVEIREETTSMEVIKEDDRGSNDAAPAHDIENLQQEPGLPLDNNKHIQEPVKEERIKDPVLDRFNRDYSWHGDHTSIKEVFDDGVFTYIIMPQSRTFPAVFTASKKRRWNRRLEPVAHVIKPGMIVVHRVIEKKEIIVLRSGAKKEGKETIIYRKKTKTSRKGA